MTKSLMIASVLCANLLTPASGHDDAVTRTPIGPWTMVCEDGVLECTLSQTRAETGQSRPVEMNVALARQGENVSVHVKTPPVAQPQLRLRFQSQRSMFLKDPTCTERGCDFAITLDRAAVDELTSERRVELTIAVSPDELVALVFDLRDLANALAQLPVPR